MENKTYPSFCQKMNCPDYPAMALGEDAIGYACTARWRKATCCCHVDLNGKYPHGLLDGDLKHLMWVRFIERVFREEVLNEYRDTI